MRINGLLLIPLLLVSTFILVIPSGQTVNPTLASYETNASSAINGQPLTVSEQMNFGVEYLSTHYHYEPYYLDNSELERDFALFQQEGLDYITLVVIWNYSEPELGEYNDASIYDLERVCDLALEYDLKVIIDFHTLMFDDSWTMPDWLSPRNFVTVLTDSTAREAWLDFLDYVASSLDHVENIWSWNMMNEPWGSLADIDDWVDLWSEMKNVFKTYSDRPVSVRFATQTIPNSFNNNSTIYSMFDYLALNYYEEYCNETTLTNVALNATEKACPVVITEFGSEATTDLEQKNDYRRQLDLFRFLNITDAIAWLWRADYDQGNLDAPGEGFNLAKDIDGNPRPAFYLLDDEYELTINIEGSGSVTPGVGSFTYASGSEVELNALADPGWTFNGWTGNLTGTNNQETIIMDCDKSVNAVFTNAIYIRTDGSVDPVSAPIQRNGDTYTFSTDIYVPIIVERDNIILDGNNHNLLNDIHTTTRVGVNLSERKNVEIKNIQIEYWDVGISVQNSTQIVFIENDFHSCTVGLLLENSSDNTFSQNIVSYCEPTGIKLQNFSSNNTFFNNRIGEAINGLEFINQCDENIVFENYFSYAKILINSSKDNIFYHNDIFGGLPSIINQPEGWTNVWDNGYPSGGNFWLAYLRESLDENGDEIGDIPFVVDEGNQDNYPLMNEWEPKISFVGSSNWCWTDHTVINAVEVQDVDGDGLVEVVTGGYHNDGTRDVAQLVVWNESGTSVDDLTTWYWTGNTMITTIAICNLDGDEAQEIVTGGYYFDGERKVAQLVIWDGITLEVEGLRTWYWNGDTEISTIKIADIDRDGSFEIVTGGYYNDGVRDIAQLIVWTSDLTVVEDIATWYWTGNTKINCIGVKNVDEDSQLEIITGGYYTESQKNAQLVIWDGLSLSADNIVTWAWTSNTEVNSVVAANVDDDPDLEIVTGGYYNDETRDVAQLVIWSNDLQTVEDLATWYWTSDTQIETICIEDVDFDTNMEILTGGFFNDNNRDVAQLVIWDAESLAVDYLTDWYWTSNTCICSIGVENLDADLSMEIVTGGHFNDNSKDNAQITIWQID